MIDFIALLAFNFQSAFHFHLKPNSTVDAGKMTNGSPFKILFATDILIYFSSLCLVGGFHAWILI